MKAVLPMAPILRDDSAIAELRNRKKNCIGAERIELHGSEASFDEIADPVLIKIAECASRR